MKISCRQKPGFTLMEIIATLVFIFVISVLIMMIELSRINYVLNQKKDISFRDVKNVVGTIISSGYIDEDGLLLKQIPPVGHTDDKRGFCDRMAVLLQATGTIDCTAPLVTDFGPFDISSMNFQTASGIRYFNLALRTNKNYYTIFVDVNGEKGKEQIGNDIVKYYVTLDGQVLNKKPSENREKAAQEIENLKKILDVKN